jgi:hypothetical protein
MVDRPIERVVDLNDAAVNRSSSEMLSSLVRVPIFIPVLKTTPKERDLRQGRLVISAEKGLDTTPR